MLATERKECDAEDASPSKGRLPFPEEISDTDVEPRLAIGGGASEDEELGSGRMKLPSPIELSGVGIEIVFVRKEEEFVAEGPNPGEKMSFPEVKD